MEFVNQPRAQGAGQLGHGKLSVQMIEEPGDREQRRHLHGGLLVHVLAEKRVVLS